ncbi:hypothetical protein D3C74_273770 [compost metagenome]
MTAQFIRTRYRSTFLHGFVLHQRLFDFERADRITGANNNVIPASLVPEIPFLVLMCPIPGHKIRTANIQLLPFGVQIIRSEQGRHVDMNRNVPYDSAWQQQTFLVDDFHHAR